MSRWSETSQQIRPIARSADFGADSCVGANITLRFGTLSERALLSCARKNCATIDLKMPLRLVVGLMY